MSRLAPAVLVLALVVAPGGALAQESHPPVELRLDASVERCVGALDPVRRAVQLDLGAELVPAGRLEATRVDVVCEGDVATIRIDDPLTGKLVERRVTLGQQPLAGRARLLGLTIAETVAASWVELEMTHAGDEAAPDAPPRPTPGIRHDAAAVAQARLREHPADPPPRPVLSAAGLVRLFGDDDLVTVGARAEGAWPLGERFALALDLAGEWGTVSAVDGDVDARLLSVAPRVAARARSRVVELSASLGFRLGMVELRGRSTAQGVFARSFFAPWGGPVLDLEARAPLTEHVGVGLGLEAGLVTLEVEGQSDGARAVGISGRWGGAWLAFSWQP